MIFKHLKRRTTKLLIAEIVLLVASVFFFRSLWHLLDMFSVTNEPYILVITLVLATAVTIPAYKYVIKND